MRHKSLKIFQKRICETTHSYLTVWLVSHPVKMKTNKSFGSWKHKGEICCMLTTQQTRQTKELDIYREEEDVVFCQCVRDEWI
jgi:hypothetical protein